MFEAIYPLLERIGYTHPLHPALTHLPVGLTLGAFLLALAGAIAGRESLSRSAFHCAVLALLGLVPTVLIGLADWSRYYGGALIFPIRIKLILAGGLALVLICAVVAARRKPSGGAAFFCYTLGVMAVTGLGFYGGELVYGSAPASVQSPSGSDETDDSALVAAGADVFSQNCSFCHYTDRTADKVGPGMAGLFAMDRLPVSKWKATEDNIRKQIRTPYGEMPSFDGLSRQKMDALIAYLKTL